METGFVYDRRRDAFVQQIGPYTLIQRADERQVAVFKNGRCVETFSSRAEAKRYALES